jgi:hypothetical protein
VSQAILALRHRLIRARAGYIANPSNARLRSFLNLKARLGIFDARMCMHFGVDPKVNAGCRAAICRAYAAGLVPTSTTGGNHAAHSFHKRKNARGEGQAVDIGLRADHVGSAAGAKRLAAFQRAEHLRFHSGKLRHDLVELIGPTNSPAVLRDVETDLQEGSPLENQHDNHVHEAYRG